LGDFTDIRLLLPVTWDDLTVCDPFVHFTRETSTVIPRLTSDPANEFFG